MCIQYSSVFPWFILHYFLLIYIKGADIFGCDWIKSRGEGCPHRTRSYLENSAWNSPLSSMQVLWERLGCLMRDLALYDYSSLMKGRRAQFNQLQINKNSKYVRLYVPYRPMSQSACMHVLVCSFYTCFWKQISMLLSNENHDVGFLKWLREGGSERG